MRHSHVCDRFVSIVASQTGILRYGTVDEVDFNEGLDLTNSPFIGLRFWFLIFKCNPSLKFGFVRLSHAAGDATK